MSLEELIFLFAGRCLLRGVSEGESISQVVSRVLFAVLCCKVRFVPAEALHCRLSVIFGSLSPGVSEMLCLHRCLQCKWQGVFMFRRCWWSFLRRLLWSSCGEF